MAKNTRGAKASKKETAPVAEVETFEDELEDLEDADLEADEDADEDEDLEDDDEDSDDEDEDDSDLEELEDDEPAPAAKTKGKKATGEKKAAAPKREPIEFGSQWLCDLIKEKTGKAVDARGLRVLLRKLARDGGGVTREVGTDKARYQWTGPKDPQVVAVLKAVGGGALEKAKSDGLAAARAAKEKKAAEKKAAAEAAETKVEKAKGKKKAAPAEEPKAAPKPAKKAKAKA